MPTHLGLTRSFANPLGGAPGASKLSPSRGRTQRCREAADRSRCWIWASRRCCRCCCSWFTPAFQVGPGPQRLRWERSLMVGKGEDGRRGRLGESDELKDEGDSVPSPPTQIIIVLLSAAPHITVPQAHGRYSGNIS